MTKGHQVVLNPHARKRRKWALLVVFVVALGWVGWWLFDYGRQRAGFDSDASLQQMEMLELRIQALSEEGQRLRERIAILEHGKEIDEAAYVAVESDLKTLQDEVRELTQQLIFYQNIVSPADTSVGARVQTMRFETQAEAGRYLYRLILIQGPRRASRVSGRVNVSLQGLESGEEVTLSMQDLHTGEAPKGKYRFKYFQEFQGNIEFPENFEPLTVVVRLKPDGKKAKPVEEQYSWEAVTN